MVTLVLNDLSGALTVEAAEGIESWEILSHDASEMSAILPGDEVVLSVKLMDGYASLRLTSEPAGLSYTFVDNKVSFTMPFNDIKVTLQGIPNYQATFM